MVNDNLIELYKKLEELIGYCYEKYKDRLADSEREICELYLYKQGEYELALNSFLASIDNNTIKLDEDCASKLAEAKRLMMLN